jgi:transcriptional regulator with XRE-family HTH domain
MGEPPQLPDLEPITVTLRRLTAAAGLTYRALAQRTREFDQRGRGVTHSYIAGLASGKEQPSPRSVELIARALDVTPDVFGEYRLAILRHELDPKRSGFGAARKRYIELVG